MVIARQRLMKCVDVIDGDIAVLKHIDLDGGIRTHFVPVAALQSLEAALRPRTLWLEGGDLDQLIAEREEREAAAARRAATAAKRKAKRSNKLKRKVTT